MRFVALCASHPWHYCAPPCLYLLLTFSVVPVSFSVLCPVLCSFGSTSDDRPFEDKAKLGAVTLNSKRRTAPKCNFGRYSGRNAPVMTKLNKNW